MLVGAGTRIRASLPGLTLASAGQQQWVIRLPAMALEPGETKQVAFSIDRFDPHPSGALTAAEARAARDQAAEVVGEFHAAVFDDSSARPRYSRNARGECSQHLASP